MTRVLPEMTEAESKDFSAALEMTRVLPEMTRVLAEMTVAG